MERVLVTEGKTSFFAPVQNKNTQFPPGSAPIFYNRRMEANRDATVLFLSAVEPSEYLDAMGATGVRGLRVANETGVHATINDIDPAAAAEIRANVEGLGLDAEVTCQDANALMSSRRFDCVDLDPFGTPAPFIDSGCRSARRFLCITATDTAPLCGAHLKAGMRRYWARPMNTEYHSEVGLRVLLGFAARQMIKYDRGITPLFCFAHEHFIRLHLRVLPKVSAAEQTRRHIGYILQCPHCFYRAEQPGMFPERRTCPLCEEALSPIGPLWLGAINDPAFLGDLEERLPKMDLGTNIYLGRLIPLLMTELPTSSFYNYHQVARRLRTSPPPMDVTLARVQEAGYAATRTHYVGTGVKTEAPLEVVEAAVRGEKE